MTKQQAGVIGTLRAEGSNTVEYVKKCQVCRGPLVVLKSEFAKTTHDMCLDNSATVHQCPPVGSGTMPCCGRTPFEAIRDRMTLDPTLVTCVNQKLPMCSGGPGHDPNHGPGSDWCPNCGGFFPATSSRQ